MNPMVSIDVDIDGETKALNFKSLDVVPLGILRETRNNFNEQMWRTLEWALSEEDLALFDKLPSKVLTETLDLMKKASGIDLGES